MGLLDRFRNRSAAVASAPSGDVDAQLEAAANLLEESKWQEAIQAYQIINKTHPEKRGFCAAQIGAAHFALGNYDIAAACYIDARDAGESPELMELRIKVATEKASASEA